jgi:hypothetical protein
MSEEKRVIEVDSFDHRLMVNGLADFRNDLIREDKPTEDVDELLLKIIDAPTKKEKRKADVREDKLPRPTLSCMPAVSSPSRGWRCSSHRLSEMACPVSLKISERCLTTRFI